MEGENKDAYIYITLSGKTTASFGYLFVFDAMWLDILLSNAMTFLHCKISKRFHILSEATVHFSTQISLWI